MDTLLHSADFHDVVVCLVAAMETRDAYTSGHSMRVAELTLRLGQRLGLSDDKLECVHMAAHMHDIARMVLHHHERWDGKGYPCGLAGQNIPQGARIIAVADSIDAMMSRRPYREPLGEAQCRAELARCAGTQFDPAIAAAALTLETFDV